MNSITGSFTAAENTDGYLLIRSASPTLSEQPPNGVFYTPGTAIGNGTVVQSNNTTAINIQSLSSGTLYYLFVYAYNALSCQGGPRYNAENPLSGNIYTVPVNPASFAATGFSASQINLAWTKNSANNDVLIVYNINTTFGTPTGNYNPGDAVTGGGTVLYTGNATAFEHKGLNSSTRYYYRIYSKVGNVYSSYLSSDALTFCTSAPLPWNEGFESITSNGQLPPCWAINNTTTYGWSTRTSSSGTSRKPHSGTKFAYAYSYTNTDGWLFTPSFDLQAGNTYLFSMWYLTDGVDDGWNLTVNYGTDATAASMTNLIGSVDPPLTSVYQKYSQSFTPVSSGTYYIGIRETNSLGNYAYLSVDDVSMEAAVPMAYNTSEVLQQVFTPVATGSANNQVIGVKINITGNYNPVNATSFTFSTNGTTQPSDISAARLYYTGSSAVFAANNQFGADQTSLGTSFAIEGTQVLAAGNNYFWLVYDIAPGAAVLNHVDAELSSLTVGGIVGTPSPSTVEGFRQIQGALNGNYTIDNTQASNFDTGGRNFNHFGDAIVALNALGVSDPVVFQVSAGQVFPASCSNTGTFSNTINYAYQINTNGTSANTITFRKHGTGNDPIIQFTGNGTTVSNVGFFLYGADYLVFDQLRIEDGGTDDATWVDRSFYILNFGADGTCNNTFKNLTLSFTQSNPNAIGFYQTNENIVVNGVSQVAPNNNNSFLNNHLENMAKGYFLSGFRREDSGNCIGTEDGKTSTISGLLNSNSTLWYGVYANQQQNLKIYGLTIKNFTYDPSNGTGTLYGIYAQNVNSSQIYNNQISNLKGRNQVAGIYIRSASETPTHVFNNVISGLASEGASTSSLCRGIEIQYASCFYNNFIFNIQALNSTYANGPSTAGIYISSDTHADGFHNTVFLDGAFPAPTSVLNVSAAIECSYGSGSVLNIKNNLFVNHFDLTNNSNGSSKALAFFYSSNPPDYTLLQSTNNNLYYAGSPGARNLIFSDGTHNDQTLSGYKARVSPYDAQSLTENPPFISAVVPYDLRINPAVPTRCESSGSIIATPVVVEDDFEGQPRFPHSGYPDQLAHPATAPDLGADEFAGEAIDGVSPVITYSALGNSSSSPTRIFNPISITDNRALDVSANQKPRLYYKKSTDNNSFSGNTSSDNGWKWVEAGNSASPFSFTFDYAILFGGVPAFGSVIQYFVVAQDLAGNVGGNPLAGLNANGVGNILAAPNTPGSFIFLEGLCGEKHVGASQPFPYNTLSNAVNYVCSNDLTCPLTLFLDDASYSASETFPVTLTAILGSSEVNTLTIKPNTGVNPVISGNNSLAILYVYGADNIIIDGSNNGSSQRNLTLSNTRTNDGAYSAVYINSHSTGLGSENITIKNTVCKATPGSYWAETKGIYVYGKGHQNITIDNNEITNSYYGISLVGNSDDADYISNTELVNNLIGGSSKILYAGIHTSYVDGLTIAGNTVNNMLTTATSTPRGINMATHSKNVRIEGNSISQVGRDTYNSTSVGGVGICLAPAIADANILVANNVVYGMKGYYAGGSFTNLTQTVAGIWIGGTASGIEVYYNSINLFGVLASQGSSTGYKNACIYVGANITDINLKNNVLSNVSTFSSGSGHKAFAFYSDAPSTAYNEIDYNDYYPGSPIGVFSYIDNNERVSQQDLLDWKTVSGFDGHSLYINPEFNSDTNLKPDLNSPLFNAGGPVAGITSDIEKQSRHALTPTIGAYETGADMRGPVFTFNDFPNSSSTVLMNLPDWVSISDFSGVNTEPGTRPRLYYRKTTENNVYVGNTSSDNGWKWVEAENTSSPFSFIIDFTKTYGGLVQGDYLYYFFAAQDVNGTVHVSASPSAGFEAVTVGNITSFPSEPKGFYIDQTAPVITYTPFGNISGQAKRKVGDVTITDGFKLETSAGKAPRLYYKKSGENNSFGDNIALVNGWKWVEGVNTSANLWEFEIDHNLLHSSLAVGDVIDYFIVAQDYSLAPTVAGNPSDGFSATSVGQIVSAPSLPNTYTILDNISPEISYTLMDPTISTSNRTLENVLIQDNFGGAGVDNSPGNKPRLYFKKKSDANFFAGNTSADNGWKYTETTEPTSPYSFLFDYSLLTSPVQVGDTIEYFVVAQDQAATPNVGALPVEGLVAITVGNISSAPDLPCQYAVLGSFAGGSYYLGGTGTTPCSTCDYVDLSAALDDIGNKIISGPVTFILTSSYQSGEEDAFPIVVQNIYGTTSTNRVTLKPDVGVDAVISADSPEGVISILAQDHLCIEGSNNGSNSRNLSISNADASAPYVVGYGSNNEKGTSYFQIRNCNISGSVSAISNTSDFFNWGNTHNAIENNHLFDSRYGISIESDWDEEPIFLTIQDNIIGHDNAESSVYQYGIHISDNKEVTIQGNQIYNLISDFDYYLCGIYLEEVTEATISNNRIHDIKYSGDGGGAAEGIHYTSYSRDPKHVSIVNNAIYNIAGDGDAQSWYYPSGIYVEDVSGGFDILYNSISLNRDSEYGLDYEDSNFAAGLVLDNSSGIRLINNIINVVLGERTGSLIQSMGFAVYSMGNPNPFSSSDYNLFHVANHDENSMVNNGTARSLAEWRAFSKHDLHSFDGDPAFTSENNLQVLGSSPAIRHAQSLAEVTDDILGLARQELPTIGAFEFTETQTHHLVFSTIAADRFTLSWTRGNGAAVVVFMKEGDTGTCIPADNESYTANAVWPLGDQIGSSGWYCVYTGTEQSLTITGLEPGHTYRVQVCEWYGQLGNELYNTNIESDNPANATTQINAIPEVLELPTVNLDEGQTCYNAYQDITVAGNEGQVSIGPGAGAEFIAGRSVRFLPGFHAQQGSEVHAHITIDSTFCDGKVGQGMLRLPEITKSSTLVVLTNNSPSSLLEKDIKIYPNPNKGRFIIDLLHFSEKALMRVYHSNGILLHEQVLDERSSNEIQLNYIPKGVYMVKVIGGGKIFVRKIIVN